MISHEDPNDLIESVTAEIEAIIQEEINSQNVSTPTEAAVEPEVQQEAEKVELDVVPVEAQSETITDNLEQADSAEPTSAETNETTEASTEAIETVQNSDSVENVAEVKKEDYIEYTVKIASPAKEESQPSEVLENASPAFMTIESILNDAPIEETDGPRAKHLKQALRKALNNTAKSCR